MNIAITTHAKKRLKERCGINKNSAAKIANKAFNEGISFDKANDEIRRYISSIYMRHNKANNNIRIYNDTVFIFDNLTLITVFRLPKEVKQKIEDLATDFETTADEVCSKYYQLPRKVLYATNIKSVSKVKIIAVSDIVIPTYLITTYPKRQTMLQHKNYLQIHGKINTPIIIDSNKNLLDGYADYILAVQNKYDDIICIIDDSYETPMDRIQQRFECYLKQNKECASCGKPLQFQETRLIKPGGASYCVCADCATKYGLFKNPEYQNKRMKRKRSPKIDTCGLLNEIRNSLAKNSVPYKKISLLHDHTGNFVEIKSYTSIKNELLEELNQTHKFKITYKIVFFARLFCIKLQKVFAGCCTYIL